MSIYTYDMITREPDDVDQEKDEPNDFAGKKEYTESLSNIFFQSVCCFRCCCFCCEPGKTMCYSFCCTPCAIIEIAEKVSSRG